MEEYAMFDNEKIKSIKKNLQLISLQLEYLIQV